MFISSGTMTWTQASWLLSSFLCLSIISWCRPGKLKAFFVFSLSEDMYKSVYILQMHYVSYQQYSLRQAMQETSNTKQIQTNHHLVPRIPSEVFFSMCQQNTNEERIWKASKPSFFLLEYIQVKIT